MAAAATRAALVTDIKSHILRGAKALGNSHLEEKHLCSELLQNAIKQRGDLERISEGTYLCVATLERMRTLKECETGMPYNPSSDTCARILRYFGMEASYTSVTIKAAYRNKPKQSA